MVPGGSAKVSGAHLRRVRGYLTKGSDQKFLPPREENKKRLYLHPLLPLPSRVTDADGEMAEWSIAAVLKTVVRATGPGVRIPLSPLR